MLRQVQSKLNVELDEAEHGNRDTRSFENKHPYVRKHRIERRRAITVRILRDHGNDGEYDADEAVLENADPNDLGIVSTVVVSGSQIRSDAR